MFHVRRTPQVLKVTELGDMALPPALTWDKGHT